LENYQHGRYLPKDTPVQIVTFQDSAM